MKLASFFAKRGDVAERQAEQFLKQRGLTCIARNYRTRRGEIDLIMQDHSVLVFVEVRLRQHQGYGGAAGSIDLPKQRRLIAAAEFYLSQLKQIPACRFDVVLLHKLDDPAIEWVKDAFYASA
ncbi:MAG: YraN family protein [Betaproteobacteria bacterium]|nr:YraN family protein [Betaproteobacteria bacterium]